MKFYSSLIVFVFSFTISIGQVDSVHVAKKGIDSKVPIVVDKTEFWYDHKAWPWVASLIIAFISVIVNLYISLATRRTSLTVVQKQIESAVSVAKVQFQFSLSSKNRQDWINEVRTCISEFATHTRQLNILYQDTETDKGQIFVTQEKVFLYKSKVRLLLNPKIAEHTTYLSAQEDLMNVLEIHLLNSKAGISQFNNQDFLVKSDFMVEKARELLYNDWQKVQNTI